LKQSFKKDAQPERYRWKHRFDDLDAVIGPREPNNPRDVILTVSGITSDSSSVLNLPTGGNSNVPGHGTGWTSRRCLGDRSRSGIIHGWAPTAALSTVVLKARDDIAEEPIDSWKYRDAVAFFTHDAAWRETRENVAAMIDMVAPSMFLVTEVDAAAIRAIYEQDGKLSAAIDLRRRFPGITDNAKARACVRTIRCASD
jgi:hypothetical protein